MSYLGLLEVCGKMLWHVLVLTSMSYFAPCKLNVLTQVPASVRKITHMIHSKCISNMVSKKYAIQVRYYYMLHTKDVHKFILGVDPSKMYKRSVPMNVDTCW